MKRVNFFLAAIMSMVLFACKKDEHKVFFEGGTAPVLTANANALPLSFVNADQHLVRLNWTNPNYRFNTGVSSQDVNYIIEIDIAGANFKSPNKLSIAISNDLSVNFTVGQFNDYLLNELVLPHSVTQEIEMRVVSSMGSLRSGALASNVLKYSVTPYPIPPKVAPPASGKLFITGSATPGDWMGGGDPELPAQQFTKISETLFEIASINLNGDASFLFVPVYGDWNVKYGYTGGGNENNVNGDDFMPGGNDMKAPPASGAYKVTVDFQRGKFTVTKL
ncbi:MAG: SusE domain-containing protein [Chitinophagaceae bacterium]|nr:SusE domain-containing protein [Chitinophagaceae bacterium]